jgi:hypothetical protein
MKRWAGLLALFLLAAIGAMVIAPCFQPRSQSNELDQGPSYTAETVVDGFTIRIDLYHNHPFLAEWCRSSVART